MSKIQKGFMEKFVRFLVVAIIISLFLCLPSSAQLVLGQYEDEAPLRTWNTFGLTTASIIGLGIAGVSLPRESSSSLVNPALLPFLPKISLTFNGSYNAASLFKYSLVNTGVLSTEKNPTCAFYALDFAGASFRFGDWAASCSASLAESYARPLTEYEYRYQGNPYYLLKFEQKGWLKNIHLALSRKFADRFSLGIGINYLFGEFSKDVHEEYISSRITISDHLAQDFEGIFASGGIYMKWNEKWSIGFSFRTPFVKNAQSQSSYRYDAPPGGKDIQIDTSSSDEYHQPWVFGVGISYKISADFLFTSDILYFGWSRYRVHYFGEGKTGAFKNAVRAGIGLEYITVFTLFGQKILMPLRAGFIFDEQPMKNPHSYYLSYSLGTGFRWRNISLDYGVSMGKEFGSGNSLQAQRMALSLSLGL